MKLHRNFKGKKSNGLYKYPTRSANLNPMDYSYWSLAKDIVYKEKKYESTDDLLVGIKDACKQIEERGFIENMLSHID